MYIIWSWKTISIDSGVARHDMLVLCDMIFVNWYCRILHQIPAVNLFIFNYIMMLNVRSVCSVWSNIPKKTPKNKTQHKERSTHKGIIYIYIYMLIYLYRYDTLYKASHPKKIQPQWITQKRRCWHVVTWGGPLCAFSSWPQTRLSRSLPLAKLPEKIRLWEIIAICPDQVIWVFPRIGGKPQNGWWK